MQRESKNLKRKIYKCFSKNDTGGHIYREFIQGKTKEERTESINIILSFASIKNGKLKIRSKALAMIDFFLSMSQDKSWEDAAIIFDIPRIDEVIEENYKNVGSFLDKDIREIHISLIYHILILIKERKINNENIRFFKKYVKTKLDLERKFKENNLSMGEKNIYDYVKD